ncbi:KipI family sensor histidine kinase inhibitor [Trinickia symbiotica]|uniref:Allophanate hydrolase subunit 1 n=1 Tax=Trinickia symbiotica TaxID=863227 RepID=A0A2N7X9B6_9BURK|nr:5-oxoprolinase subunit PxpB [Trinickia symbiotica]PMS38211.1 allophanate hydrolase subunit 1 [Trinickia symbiotica]PPK47094.1 KipI family sensor histidine kinase inhibitor [Trinickia symbiotica]
MSSISSTDGSTTCRLSHSGERTVIVEVRSSDRVAANRVTREIAARIAAGNHPFIHDIVPAMTTVGVHYDPHRVELSSADKLPYQVVEALLEQVVNDSSDGATDSGRVVDIPVCYGGEYGVDLAEVAQTCCLSVDEVVKLHSGELVDVMMIGFAPGHPYIGLLDDKLTPPRRATPRTAVAPGSVGLANRQSVIYPVTLPGGWNLIGRTPLQMFDPSRADPCLLHAGDKVRFVSISPAEFDALNEHAGAAQ